MKDQPSEVMPKKRPKMYSPNAKHKKVYPQTMRPEDRNGSVTCNNDILVSNGDSRRAGDPYVKNWQDVAHKGAPLSVCNTFGNIRWHTRGPDKMRISSCQARFRPLTIAPFGDAYEKIGTIQRRGFF